MEGLECQKYKWMQKVLVLWGRGPWKAVNEDTALKWRNQQWGGCAKEKTLS